MMAYCKYNDIGVIPWGPLGGGHLTRPVGAQSLRGDSSKGTVFDYNISESENRIISRVEEIAKKYNKKMAQVALAWVTAKITSPLVGLSAVNRVDESLLQGFTLTEEDVKYLEEP